MQGLINDKSCVSVRLHSGIDEAWTRVTKFKVCMSVLPEDEYQKVFVSVHLTVHWGTLMRERVSVNKQSWHKDTWKSEYYYA